MIEPTKDKKAKSKKMNFVTIPILIAFLIGAGWFLYQRRSAANQYNSIITELVNQGKYKEGAAALEEFAKTAPSHMKEQTNNDLAICYRGLGQNPGLSHAQRVGYLKKAQEAAPGSLTEQEMEMISRPANIGGTVTPGPINNQTDAPSTQVVPFPAAPPSRLDSPESDP